MSRASSKSIPLSLVPGARAEDAPPDPGRHAAARAPRLLKPFVALIILAFVPALIGYGHDLGKLYILFFAEPVVLIGLLVLFEERRAGASDAQEKRFWLLLILCFSVWLFITPLSFLAVMLFQENTAVYYYAANLPYLLVYLFFFSALQAHPHVAHDPVTYPLRLLEWSGAMVLLLGLLMYFLAVPAILSSEVEGLWSSSLVTWVALDAYLLVWLWYLRGAADQQSWRSSYGWLLLGVAIWGLGDVTELLFTESLLSDPGSGSLFDLVWALGLALIAGAAVPRSSGAEEPAVPGLSSRILGMGPLVLYTSIPLILHVLVLRFGGGVDDDVHALRESVALTTSVILTVLALSYYRLFRAETQRLALVEAEVREQLAHLAFHDELTGLPNRNLFNDRLQMAIASGSRNQRKFAVLFCDLDQFKVINDSLGHEAGDETLLAAAHRLRGLVRRQDTVARLGGDEFAILLTEIHGSEDASQFARKVLSTLSEPMEIAGESHVLTASIGIVIYPDDGESEEALLKHADTAMYQSKLHGRDTFHLFTEDMNLAARQRLVVERSLRKGLAEDGFEVFYQPIIDLQTGAATGFEALVRGRDPDQGFIPPASFIDVAEQTGLIVPIGHWVLERACGWVVEHAEAVGVPVTMSVNLSPRQLREPDVVAQVSRVLEQSGLAPEYLQLEITESALLAVEACRKAMAGLRALGVRIAIDDFGTGYSALSRLRDLPVDVIKIDRSFIQDIDSDPVSQSIVRAIVSMALAMELSVVAEGVETAEALSLLQDAGCRTAQGYYFCRPLAAEDLAEQFLARRHTDSGPIWNYSL